MAETAAEAEDALLTLVKATWEANAPAGTPLLYDNQDSNRPSDPAMYGRTVLRHFGSSRESVGNPGTNSVINRRRGAVYVQIFVPQGSGTRSAMDIAEAMAQAFEDVDETLGVRLTDADINELAADGTYWQVNVVANFSYDRIS